MIKIKCSKIKYDSDDNPKGNTLKRTVTLAVPKDMIEILSAEDDYEDAQEEIKNYLIDEISEMFDCPALDLKWEEII